MKNLILLLFFVPFFVACDDSDDNNVVTADEYLPVKMTSGDYIYEWYEYNSAGSMTSWADSLQSVELFYEGSNLKKSVVRVEETYCVIEYSRTGDKILCDQSLYEDGTDRLIRTAQQQITMGPNGMPSRIDDGPFFYCTFNYDTKLNVTGIETFLMNELSEKYTFKYDSEVGAMSRVRTPAWWFVYNTWIFNQSEPYFMYSNNLIEYTVIDQRDRQSTIKYNYAYDDMEYPTGFKKETTSEKHYNYVTISYKKL